MERAMRLIEYLRSHGIEPLSRTPVSRMPMTYGVLHTFFGCGDNGVFAALEPVDDMVVPAVAIACMPLRFVESYDGDPFMAFEMLVRAVAAEAFGFSDYVNIDVTVHDMVMGRSGSRFLIVVSNLDEITSDRNEAIEYLRRRRLLGLELAAEAVGDTNYRCS